jgi:hypothetical protein
MAADHATPSQRVVGSTPTRRTDFRRPRPCRPAEQALSRDRTTSWVSGNLKRGAVIGAAVGGGASAITPGHVLGCGWAPGARTLMDLPCGSTSWSARSHAGPPVGAAVGPPRASGMWVVGRPVREAERACLARGLGALRRADTAEPAGGQDGLAERTVGTPCRAWRKGRCRPRRQRTKPLLHTSSSRPMRAASTISKGTNRDSSPT